jgi:hypothetical protein
MKTLREVLLARHRAAEPKLDKIREQVLANLAAGATSPLPSRNRPQNREVGGGHAFREILVSIRWHLTGLSAAWGIILLLGFASRETPDLTGLQQAQISLRQLMLTLRENRRQLLEFSSSTGAPEPAAPKPAQPQHRSELQVPSAIRFLV